VRRVRGVETLPVRGDLDGRKTVAPGADGQGAAGERPRLQIEHVELLVGEGGAGLGHDVGLVARRVDGESRRLAAEGRTPGLERARDGRRPPIYNRSPPPR